MAPKWTIFHTVYCIAVFFLGIIRLLAFRFADVLLCDVAFSSRCEQLGLNKKANARPLMAIVRPLTLWVPVVRHMPIERQIDRDGVATP